MQAFVTAVAKVRGKYLKITFEVPRKPPENLGLSHDNPDKEEQDTSIGFCDNKEYFNPDEGSEQDECNGGGLGVKSRGESGRRGRGQE